MKNIVYVTINPGEDSSRLEHLVEVVAKPMGDDPVVNSLAGQAQEIACKEAVTRLSKIHQQYVFSWGHEEKDGRTWLHGVAQKGEYRSV
jgi:hypothetical protein